MKVRINFKLHPQVQLDVTGEDLIALLALHEGEDFRLPSGRSVVIGERILQLGGDGLFIYEGSRPS